MNITTEIEKKNLEAHVELCAERYKSLDAKLDTVERRVSDVERKLEIKMDAVESILDDIKTRSTVNKLGHRYNYKFNKCCLLFDLAFNN
jgi:hypothetical protein